MEQLLKWAKENGTRVHGAITIDTNPNSGYLLRATADIPGRSTIIGCSYQTMLSCLNVMIPNSHTKSSFPQSFIDQLSINDPNILSNFFLVEQYVLGERSFWYPYIKLLPQPDESDKLGPNWWSEADKAFLGGTNAEPAIKQRKQLFESQWRTGMELLQGNLDECEHYTYLLYQWAATIFGSRSFRASLTVPEQIIRSSFLSQDDKARYIDHLQNDRFSVLLPLLDLGNHNGKDEVTWRPDPIAGLFALQNRRTVARGSEVFNYYGEKSNSELLVGYGFILPGANYDAVNLKVIPTTKSLYWRQVQNCYRPTQLELRHMFQVKKKSYISEGRKFSKVEYLEAFEHGLIETLCLMVANKREKSFVRMIAEEEHGRESEDQQESDSEDEQDATHPPRTPCLEKYLSPDGGAMARNFAQVFFILNAKVESEIGRMDESGNLLGAPFNRNQSLAMEYRTRQRIVLETAIEKFCYDIVFGKSRFCTHRSHRYNRRWEKAKLEILSLECAYSYLEKLKPAIHDQVVQLIGEDQEESLPLKWEVLIEDWNHAYWIIWIFTICMIQASDPNVFQEWPGKLLKGWLDNLRFSSFNDKSNSTLYAEHSEQETVDMMIEAIAKFPQFKKVRRAWRQEFVDASAAIDSGDINKRKVFGIKRKHRPSHPDSDFATEEDAGSEQDEDWQPYLSPRQRKRDDGEEEMDEKVVAEQAAFEKALHLNRNFASFLAYEETFAGAFKMESGKVVSQNVLAVWMKREQDRS